MGEACFYSNGTIEQLGDCCCFGDFASASSGANFALGFPKKPNYEKVERVLNFWGKPKIAFNLEFGKEV